MASSRGTSTVAISLHRLIYYRASQFTYPDFLPSKRPDYDEQFVLQVAVQLPEPTSVHIMEHNTTDTAYTAIVSHLPPLRLNLLLPPNYPLEHPPVILSLDSVNDWLTPANIQLLKDSLTTLWDKENVLGIWIDHIRNGELLAFLDLQHSSPTYIR